MSNFSVRVSKFTRKLEGISAYNNIFIAYSGGVDSHVLLQLCGNNQQVKDKITAVYINHGLEKKANDWAKHCKQVCHELGVKFMSLNVNAHTQCGESPEEAARNARYGALKALLGNNDALLVAQHADDQLETVLIQLFRGGGLAGLAGMPPSMAFGQGVLLRPLLALSKREILEYAHHHKLQWVEDPSNEHSRYDRNFLRNEILPLLKQRWPSLEKTVARSARHCADAESVIAKLASGLLKAAINDDNTLNISYLQNHDESYQRLIIRQWFKQLELRMPSQGVVKRIRQEVVAARADANPIVEVQGRQIRRYRQRLYCINSAQAFCTEGFILPSDKQFFNVAENIRYAIVPSSDGIPADLWHHAQITVNFRAGGESISLPGRKGTHSLKKLFQDAGIPPWERAAIPIIYLNGRLAAVGDYWVAAEFYCTTNTDCVRLVRSHTSAKGNDGTASLD